MSVNLTINGTAYSYPNTGDQNWGDTTTNWATAVTSGMLQKAGGTFTLTSDVNFGASFGLLSAYFTSVTANAASAGAVRLANTDTIGFRNHAGSADLALGPDTSDNLTWNGHVLASSAGLILVPAGGTGRTTLTNHGVLVGAATAAITQLAAAPAGTLLSGQGASSDPSFTATPTLGIAGTTLGSLALCGNTSGTISILPQAAAGTFNFNLPITAGSTGQALLSGGGVGAAMTWGSVITNPMTTLGDIIYEDATPVPARLAGNITSTKKYLSQTGTGAISAVPAWAQVAFADLSGTIAKTQCTVPTVQAFTSTPSQTGWLFTVTSANATVGATYTNNSNTYTVLGTISSGTQLFMSGTGATSGGTLTRSGGSGDATITFSAKVALGTYTTPANVLYLKLKIVGAGSGGAASGTASQGTPNAGSLSAFGNNLIIANGGGVAGTATGLAGVGGTATIAAGPLSIAAVKGGGGNGGNSGNISTVGNAGGMGGSSPFGGAGGGGPDSNNGASATGQNAGANSGSGGGGAGGAGNVGGMQSGGGGASGGYAEAIITSPAATYPIIIGSKGAGATAGTNGAAGGDGADGYAVVEEFYQ